MRECLVEPDTIEFAKVDITDTKHLDRSPFSRRRSIMFVTIADPQITLVDIQKMMETGMNIARFKTSHTTKGDRAKLIRKVDRAAAFLAHKYNVNDWPCATCVELRTCVVQTGLIEEEQTELEIEVNSEILLTCELSEYNTCNKHKVFVNNPCLTADAKVGMEINIGQDEIILKCLAIVGEKTIKCIVTKGGMLKNMAYVCMRGAKCTRPYITKKDLHLVKFAMEYQVDVVIINYPRNIETVKKIKQYLGTKLKRPIIIPGLCTEEGLNSIDDFIKESDGILLSREFLAFELKSALAKRMGQIQRYVGAKCLQAGKPFYISGEIFREALTTGHFCTREISDVTNALLDGASGFVLSEGLNIDYLMEVMKTVDDLCVDVEPLTNDKTKFWNLLSAIKMPVNAAEACAMSCALIANQTNARVIVVPTVTGRSAYLLNWLLPIALVIAVSTKIRTTRRLETFRSVIPLLYKGAPHRTWYATVQARVQYAIQHAVERHWLVYGDHYVTLEKGTEDASFCDTVRVWNVTVTRRNVIQCPESYHDFTIDTFAPEGNQVRNKKSVNKLKEVIEEKVTEKRVVIIHVENKQDTENALTQVESKQDTENAQAKKPTDSDEERNEEQDIEKYEEEDDQPKGMEKDGKEEDKNIQEN